MRRSVERGIFQSDACGKALPKVFTIIVTSSFVSM